MNYGHGKMGYADRQSLRVNIGEKLFLDWCSKNGWGTHRVGFDEKSGFVRLFYNLGPLMRNLPDFFIEKGDRSFLVNVKGTCNIKQAERKMMPSFVSSFSSPLSPLVYAFCFSDHDVIFCTSEDVMEKYDKAEDRMWPDGVIYRSIEIKNGTDTNQSRGGRGGSSFNWQEVLSKLPEAHAV